MISGPPINSSLDAGSSACWRHLSSEMYRELVAGWSRRSRPGARGGPGASPRPVLRGTRPSLVNRPREPTTFLKMSKWASDPPRKLKPGGNSSKGPEFFRLIGHEKTPVHPRRRRPRRGHLPNPPKPFPPSPEPCRQRHRRRRPGKGPADVPVYLVGRHQFGLVRFFPAVIRFLGYDPSPPSVSLAERIQAARWREGISQRELARKLGLDPSTVQAWEAGQVRRRYPRLVRLFEEYVEGL